LACAILVPFCLVKDCSPLHPNRVYRMSIRAVKRSAFRDVPQHGLRHTHATVALQACVNPKIVQERLGHSTVAITLDTYSHAIPQMDVDAAAAIAEKVRGATR
jgi:integrase